MEFKRPKSHYLRHAVEVHPNVPPEALNFRMKILSSHRTAFERQIREAVLIDAYSGPNLMNSKLEYTRCSFPKLSVKIGNKQPEEDPQIVNEKSIIDKIKMLYKSEKKRTENPEKDDQISDHESRKRVRLDKKVDGGESRSNLGSKMDTDAKET